MPRLFLRTAGTGPPVSKRREIKLHLVHELRVEGLAQHVSATLNQDARDFPPTEIGQHPRESVFPR